MQLIGDKRDDASDALLLAQDLGVAIRLSFEAKLDEPLPAEMGLLLVRLALVEVLKDAAMQEGQTEPKSSLTEWAEAFQRSLESRCWPDPQQPASFM